MGKDDCQPSGPGTIVRITAHQVEVLWEGETARRYRRAQLYNLRHVKLISAAAEPRCKPPNRLESASFVGVCVVRPAAKQDQVSIEVGRWTVGGDGARWPTGESYPCRLSHQERSSAMASMDWDDYLRQEASMYRQLAEKPENVFGKQELLDLAAVCEEVANSIEDRLTGG
jgi:hypothetical protein